MTDRECNRNNCQHFTDAECPGTEGECVMLRPIKPPCIECGAMTPEEAETKCICGGDKDHCHGCELWPD